MATKLKPITYDAELSAFDMSLLSPQHGSIITKLTLLDYDWMAYRFKIWLPTKDQGLLKAEMEYFGCSDSEMTVKQMLDGKAVYHKISFSSDLFEAFIVKYMTAHIEQWGSKRAFCGEQMGIDFFNEILASHISWSVEATFDSVQGAYYIIVRNTRHGKYESSKPIAIYTNKANAEKACKNLNYITVSEKGTRSKETVYTVVTFTSSGFMQHEGDADLGLKAYVILKNISQGEYTEGHYYTSAKDSSEPVAVFCNREDAAKECSRLNAGAVDAEPDDADWYRDREYDVPDKTPGYTVAKVPLN